MSLNIRLYNINTLNDFSISYSKSFNQNYIFVDPLNNGEYAINNDTEYVIIENVDFDTLYYIKIEDVITGRYSIKTIKTHDSKFYSCYDSINFYLDVKCDENSVDLYDLIENHSSAIDGTPYSYYIYTGLTDDISSSILVGSYVTDPDTKKIHTLNNVPVEQTVYVFLVHADGYHVDNECDGEIKKQGGYDVKSFYCESIPIPNSLLFCTGTTCGSACYDCEGTITLYYNDSLPSTTLYTDIGLTTPYNLSDYVSYSGTCYYVNGSGVILDNAPCPSFISGVFCYGITNIDACNCENTVTLYYNDPLELYTMLYTDMSLTTPYTGSPYLMLDDVVYDLGTDSEGMITGIESCIGSPNSLDFCTGTTCDNACEICETTIQLYYLGDLTTGTTLYTDSILFNVLDNVPHISYVSFVDDIYSGVCYTVNGLGEISNIENCVLCDCPSITGLTIVNVSSNSVALTYNNINSGHTYSYILSNMSGTTIQSGSTTLNEDIITGLTASTQYTISIITHCEDCNSSPYITTFTTLSKPDSNILIANNVTGTTLAISGVTPAYFVIDSGTFPLSNGEPSITGYGSYSGTTSFDVRSYSGGSIKFITYVNSIIINCISITANGIYGVTFSFSTSDTVEFIFEDGVCE